MRSDGADMTDVLRQDDVRPCIDQGLLFNSYNF